jgi:CRISPR/Cas system-associated exonuclease Cas4 (RecB family)
MEFVHAAEDLPFAGVKLLEEYPFEDREMYLIKGAEIVSHPELKAYFSAGIHSVNEQGIFTRDGIELRPDRLVFDKDEVVVIDYKTGVEKEDDIQQINTYAKALEELNYKISKKLIVYIHKELTIKNVT